VFSGNGRLCDADTWKAFGLIHFPDQDDDEDDADIDQVKQGSFFLDFSKFEHSLNVNI